MVKHSECLAKIKVPGGSIAVDAEHENGNLVAVHAYPLDDDGTRNGAVDIPGWATEPDSPILIWQRVE